MDKYNTNDFQKRILNGFVEIWLTRPKDPTTRTGSLYRWIRVYDPRPSFRIWIKLLNKSYSSMTGQVAAVLSQITAERM